MGVGSVRVAMHNCNAPSVPQGDQLTKPDQAPVTRPVSPTHPSRPWPQCPHSTHTEALMSSRNPNGEIAGALGDTHTRWHTVGYMSEDGLDITPLVWVSRAPRQNPFYLPPIDK